MRMGMPLINHPTGGFPSGLPGSFHFSSPTDFAPKNRGDQAACGEESHGGVAPAGAAVLAAGLLHDLHALPHSADGRFTVLGRHGVLGPETDCLSPRIETLAYSPLEHLDKQGDHPKGTSTKLGSRREHPKVQKGWFCTTGTKKLEDLSTERAQWTGSCSPGFRDLSSSAIWYSSMTPAASAS